MKIEITKAKENNFTLDFALIVTRGLERVEMNSASRIEQFHLEGGTKYNIFPKKWDF